MRRILSLASVLLAAVVAAGCSGRTAEPRLIERQASPTFAPRAAPTVPAPAALRELDDLPGAMQGDIGREPSAQATGGEGPYYERGGRVVEVVIFDTAKLHRPREHGCPDGLVPPAELIPVRIPASTAELIPTEIPELLPCLIPPARSRPPVSRGDQES